MNLDELRSVQNRERQTDSLQHLRDSFYEEVGTYIADLKAERERVADRSDDPWSNPEIQQLSDEIDTAEEVAESIYERRMGKLVKDASLAAAGYATDTEGLTLEEERLFEDLVGRIETNKTSVLEVLSGDQLTNGSPVTATDEPTATTTGQEEHTATTTPESPISDAESSPPDHQASGATGTAGAAEPGAPESRKTEDPAHDGVDAASVMNPDGDPPMSEAERPPEEVENRTPSAAGTGDDPSGDPLVDDSAVDAESPGDPPAPPTSEPDLGGSNEPTMEAHTEPSTADGAHGNPSSGGDVDGSTTGSESDEAVDRTTVRITSDIGEILGIDDHEYHLTADDVVTLPRENAEPLVERDAAEPLD
jgi:DNA replication factor GINS